MSWIILGFGLVLVLEGLAFALAPSRLDQLVAMIAAIPPAKRRVMGVVMVAIGVAMVGLWRLFGAI